eukprot:3188155-Rhodomonas_salina.1
MPPEAMADLGQMESDAEGDGADALKNRRWWPVVNSAARRLRYRAFTWIRPSEVLGAHVFCGHGGFAYRNDEGAGFYYPVLQSTADVDCKHEPGELYRGKYAPRGPPNPPSVVGTDRHLRFRLLLSSAESSPLPLPRSPLPRQRRLSTHGAELGKADGGGEAQKKASQPELRVDQVLQSLSPAEVTKVARRRASCQCRGST